jgi:hypothetical protein
LYITEEIQERTLDIGVLCSGANYVGTSEYYRVIKHEYIGTRIMHCLVKGTLSRQPWFVFCVFCVRLPAAGGWRNRESSTRLRRWPTSAVPLYCKVVYTISRYLPLLCSDRKDLVARIDDVEDKTVVLRRQRTQRPALFTNARYHSGDRACDNNQNNTILNKITVIPNSS